MNYHNITTDDMNNGEGLRVVLWLSGCSHHCKGCQNPQTWNENSGIEFDSSAENEIFEELKKDYIAGITFSGGDPLHENNLDEVLNLVNKIHLLLPNKTIWLYTGYTWESIMYSRIPHPLNHTAEEFLHWNQRNEIVSKCNVLVDGRYEEPLKDVSLHWRGSSNQRVIDIQQSIKKGKVVLYNT